jgi:type II secretory pathway pseudopilin PulG
VRLRDQSGFGLMELLVAMFMLNIGILAMLAAFNSGIWSLRRASKAATASTLADTQIELYRGLKYGSIALDSSALAGVDNVYSCDSALGSSCPNSTSAEVTTTCSGSPLPKECQPSQSVTGPDHQNYRIDTYVLTVTPPTGRSEKLVTVVVRDANKLTARPLAREATTFDQSTGS